MVTLTGQITGQSSCSLSRAQEKRRSGGAGAFKFEAHWLKEEGCREVVKAAWNSGVDGGANLSSHLRGVASS
jgi:hypothetical protein